MGEPEQVIELSGVNCWAIGPDNRHLAVVYADGKLELCDIETAARVRSLGTARANSWPVFSPSGQYVAFHAAGRAVHVVDVESGKLVRELTPGEAEFDFAWHPDGKTLAIGPYPEGIVFWDVETGKKGRVLPHRGGGMRLSFNATGEMLLSHTWWDGGLRLWHSQTGKLLLSGTLGLDIVGFHPTLDGRWLHFSSEPGATLWEINPGNVYRTIAQDSVASGEVTDCAFTQDARLLVIASQRGLALWDVASVTPLAKTPVATDGVVFDPSGQLITSGPAGLLRWPVATAETESRGNRDVQQLQIGPPQSLAALPSSIPRSLRTSRDGRLVAMPHGTDATVIHLDRVGSPISLGPHDDVRFAAVSPDGDLVATGSWLVGIKVWDVQSGKLVADLPVGGLCGVEFSADGRWLATSSGGGRLWRVGNWEQATSLGGIGSAASGLVLAFSPLLQRPDVVPKDRTNEEPLESSILAMAQSTGVVRLIDPETARDLAELTDPYKHRVRTMRFSPDGTKLVISTNDDGGMEHIWDLRLLRAELAALDLDWAWPPLPAAESDHEQRLLAVHVDIGSSLAASQSQEEKARSDIDRYRGAYVANPDNAMACNNLAWVLVTVPEELRRVDEALALAEKAVQLAPQNMLYTNTLGVVYYRAGRYREAIECLESNLERQEDKELAFDLYFLAMSYHHLGDPGRARELLIWSNRWVESRTQEDALTPSQIAELAAFRREAVSLLGK